MPKNRLVNFESFESFYGKRIFPVFTLFSYFGIVLVLFYMLFDYTTYKESENLFGVVSARFVALFFAVMVVIASQHSYFKGVRVIAITTFGTMGYSAITFSYIVYDNVIYFVAFNWFYYLVATMMLTPLLTKKIYIIMESYQIALVVVLMVLFGKTVQQIADHVVLAIPLVLYVYAVVVLNRKNGLESYENAYNMHVLSSTDGLSHLLNRRSWYEVAKEFFASEKELAFIMLDIDHFKKVNDTYGHEAGDKVIKSISDILMQQTRNQDFVGRLGGEEFGIILPKTTREDALTIADRIRESIEKNEIHYNHQVLKVTSSFGVAIKSASMKRFSELVNLGDELLYKAKNEGRNRVMSIDIESEKI